MAIDVKFHVNISVTSDGKNVTFSPEQWKCVENKFHSQMNDVQRYIRDLLSSRDPQKAYEDAMGVL